MTAMLLHVAACTSDGPAESGLPTLDLDAALRDAVAANEGYGGGILRAQTDEEVRWVGAGGDATYGGESLSAEADFEIASVTKTFTATTVLLLTEEGAFELDDPLTDTLPVWSTGLLVIDGEDLTGSITLRQLLNHTSGLPDYWSDPPYGRSGMNLFLADFVADPERVWTADEILAYVPDLDPVARPGVTWHYSDTNYVLLGLIVERATGDELHDAMRERILDPLGLDDTWMSFREERATPTAHRYEATWDMTDKPHQSADWAGGGLVSTAEDLADFLLALAGGELYASGGTLDEMLTRVDTGTEGISYGLGVFHVELDDGALWGHDGYGNSFMYLYTTDDTVFSGTLDQTENDWWPMVATAL